MSLPSYCVNSINDLIYCHPSKIDLEKKASHLNGKMNFIISQKALLFLFQLSIRRRGTVKLR